MNKLATDLYKPIFSNFSLQEICKYRTISKQLDKYLCVHFDKDGLLFLSLNKLTKILTILTNLILSKEIIKNLLVGNYELNTYTLIDSIIYNIVTYYFPTIVSILPQTELELFFFENIHKVASVLVIKQVINTTHLIEISNVLEISTTELIETTTNYHLDRFPNIKTIYLRMHASQTDYKQLEEYLLSNREMALNILLEYGSYNKFFELKNLDLSYLKSLHINFKYHFMYEFCDELGLLFNKLMNLEKLYLEDIADNVPENISQLTKLKELKITVSELCVDITIPKSISNLSLKKFTYIEANQGIEEEDIISIIPWQVYNINTLEELEIRAFNFNFQIVNMSSIKKLYLCGVKFNGDIFELPNLEILKLSNLQNSLSLKKLDNLPKLQNIKIDNCAMTIIL